MEEERTLRLISSQKDTPLTSEQFENLLNKNNENKLDMIHWQIKLQ